MVAWEEGANEEGGVDWADGMVRGYLVHAFMAYWMDCRFTFVLLESTLPNSRTLDARSNPTEKKH